MARLGRAQPFKPLIRRAAVLAHIAPKGIEPPGGVTIPVTIPFTLQIVSFGTPELTSYIAITVAGIASAEAFGDITLAGSEGITVAGIASAEAFGDVTVNPAVAPAGIASGELFGTPRVDLRVTPAGIASGVVFGTTVLYRYILPAGIASGVVFGSHYIGTATAIAPNGIASAAVCGVPRLFDHGVRSAAPTPQVFTAEPEVLIDLEAQLTSPERTAMAAADKMAAAELVAPSKILVLFYDKIYRTRGECNDYIELQVAFPRHLVETGSITLKSDDALVPAALLCHEEVVPVTVEIGSMLWSGRIKIARDRWGHKGEGDTVTCELEGDRAWLMKILAWPNFLLPIQAQFPPRGVAIGPAISVIRWIIATQCFRIQSGLWDLVNNLGSLNLDWRSWFGTLLMADVLGPDGHFDLADIMRVLRTPIYVVSTNLLGALPGVLLDTSPFISVNWRMDKIYDLVDQIVKDNGLVVEVKLWRPGDPQPDENMIFPLTVPTIVVDVKDRMGIVGPTHTFLDGILKTLVDLQDSVFGEITKPFLNPYNEPVPDGFNIAPALGLHFVPPWTLFMADNPQSGCWGELAHHHPLAWRTVVGGQSPKWMNDFVNATLSWVLDMMMIIIGLTGVPSNLLDGLFSNVLLAFALADNMDRRIKGGPYAYPEWFTPTGHSPYNIDGIFALKREQYLTRGYVSGIVGFDNGSPYEVGRDLFVGSLASIVRRGKVYTDFVENVIVTDTRNEVKAEVQIGDGIAEEDASVKTYRKIVKAQEMINILMLTPE